MNTEDTRMVIAEGTQATTRAGVRRMICRNPAFLLGPEETN
jgi:hypothetical protein